MRVALINTPYLKVYGRLVGEGFHTFPLGLGYIAATLKREGHDVRFFDPEPNGWGPEEVRSHLIEFNPALVGISFSTPNFNAAKRLAKIAREALPNCKIVVGGPHASAIWEATLKETPEADYAVVGEGEATTSELARVLESGSETAIASIKGLAYSKEGGVFFNGHRPYIEDLDSLPMPARELVDLRKYKTTQRYRGFPITNISTSRGCPYKCTFCACHPVMGYKVRTRSAESVLEEIIYIQKKYGIRDLVFYDDTWTVNRSHVESICEGILRKNIKLGFWAFTRANTLDEDMARLMKRAGCHTLFIGVESGDPEILKKIKKGVTLEQYEKAFELCRKYKISTNGSFIIGFPEETRESARRTIEFACRLKPDTAMFNRMIPIPGSAHFDLLPENERNDWERFVMKGAKAAPSISTLSTDEITKLLTEAYVRFYFRPSQLLRMARTYKNPRELGQVALKGKRLMVRLLEWGQIVPIKDSGAW